MNSSATFLNQQHYCSSYAGVGEPGQTKVLLDNTYNFKLCIFFNNFERKMKVIKNDKIAELVGLSFGDGSLTRRKDCGVLRFQLRGNVTEDRDHYQDYIIPLFNTYISQLLLNRNVPLVESKYPYASFGIAIQNNTVGEFLSQLGIPIGRKGELKIPSWIKEDKNYLSSFIRGVFDTDGSVFCKRNYSIKNNQKHTQIKLKIVTVSKNLAFELKESLDKLTIKNYIKIQYKEKDKDAYHVEVSGGINVEKWFKIIGSNNPKHILKVLNIRTITSTFVYTNVIKYIRKLITFSI